MDLVYPPALYCICCGKIIDETRPYSLCNDCFGEMKWATGRTCEKCGKPLSESSAGNICHSCKASSHNFRRGYACCEYGTQEKTIVQKLKFRDRTDIAKIIAEMMHDRLALERSLCGESENALGLYELSDFEQTLYDDPAPEWERGDYAFSNPLQYDVIVPVPMFRAKKLKRGYNQAELIASHLAKAEGIDLYRKALVRTHETAAMKGLSANERRLNMAGSFALDERYVKLIRGKQILLVDDIYTTGATVDETASVLKEAGASAVDFIAFASGADMIKAE